MRASPRLLEVKQAFDAATSEQRGLTVPVVVTVFADRGFELTVKTLQTAALLRRAPGIAKGASAPGGERAGRVTREQLRDVARTKLPDLNTDDLDAAERIVAGTSRSMGLDVIG